MNGLPASDPVKSAFEDNVIWNRIINCIYEAVCVIDANGIVVVWNKSSEHLYHIPAGEIVGRHISEFFPDAMVDKVRISKKAMENISHSPREGTHILATAVPLYAENGLFLGAVCSDRDYAEVLRLSTELRNAQSKLNFLEKEIKKSTGKFGNIIGSSPKIISLIATAQQIAPTNTNVIITGESGTGKEMFARGIHDYSGRNGLFVPVNCSAIPPELFESEFFGYVSGAFTGARKKGRTGFFELANGGTLLLDEIGDMPLFMQAKLLRALQEQEIFRVGDEKSTRLDVRVISATNKSLPELVKQGKFREDLYYRLNVVELHLPALRERKEDIPLLVNYFIQCFAGKHKKEIHGADRTVIEYFREYPWPGNIREMMNVIENMVVIAGGMILQKDDIPASPHLHKEQTWHSDSVTLDLPRSKGELEQRNIRKALELCHHNKSKAADLLNIPRSTLYAKMQLYGME